MVVNLLRVGVYSHLWVFPSVGYAPALLQRFMADRDSGAHATWLWLRMCLKSLSSEAMLQTQQGG